jgi:hypothetical protein
VHKGDFVSYFELASAVLFFYLMKTGGIKHGGRPARDLEKPARSVTQS